MVQRQKLIGIVASVALAAVGTALLVSYVRGAEDRALKGEKKVNVLVVGEAIAKGTKAEDIAPKVREERVPAKVVANGALSGMASLAGHVAVVDLVPGEQLVASRFAPAATADLGTPPGMLQVTVSLEMVRAMGGEVREGDTVAVLASYDEGKTTRMVLQKVRVTKVRNQQGSVADANPEGKAAPGAGFFITLALDAPSVEKLVHGAEHGRLWLAHEPKEASEAGTKVQTIGSVNL